jgi:hypothetical protein
LFLRLVVRLLLLLILLLLMLPLVPLEWILNSYPFLVGAFEVE